MPRTRSGFQSSGWPTRSLRSLNASIRRQQILDLFGPDSPPSSQRSSHSIGVGSSQNSVDYGLANYSPPSSPGNRSRSIGVQANLGYRDTRHRDPDNQPYTVGVKVHKRRKPKK